MPLGRSRLRFSGASLKLSERFRIEFTCGPLKPNAGIRQPGLICCGSATQLRKFSAVGSTMPEANVCAAHQVRQVRGIPARARACRARGDN